MGKIESQRKQSRWAVTRMKSKATIWKRQLSVLHAKDYFVRFTSFSLSLFKTKKKRSSVRFVLDTEKREKKSTTTTVSIERSDNEKKEAKSVIRTKLCECQWSLLVSTEQIQLRIVSFFIIRNFYFKFLC